MDSGRYTSFSKPYERMIIMKVNGVYVADYMKLAIMSHEIPDEPAPDEVLLKVMACGLCCWDSWLYRGVSTPGPYPFVMGHEGVGIVEKVGSLVKNLKPGDKVFCATGNNSDMMSEYCMVKEFGLVKLPDDTTDWAGVVYEPACCVFNLINITNIQMGDHVVLVGAGYMGLQTLQCLTRATQAGRITVFEIREDRREMAKKLTDEVLDPNSEEGQKVIQEIKAAGGADVVIEFSADESGFRLADSLTKEAGKFTIGSYHRHDMMFNPEKWHMGGLTVYNLSPFSNAHYADTLPRAYTMIKKGAINPAEFITHTAYYKDMDAMENMFQRACDKKDNYMKGAILFYKD